jgi:hypothetical protein
MYMSGPAQRIVCVPIEQQRVAEAPHQERESAPPAEPVREPVAPSSR